MVNFGPLSAENVSLVWGTPGNFNGFRVLAALLHGTVVVGVSQTAAFNRGRHLYSAGRPSRSALAHISSVVGFRVNTCSEQNGFQMYQNHTNWFRHFEDLSSGLCRLFWAGLYSVNGPVMADVSDQ